MQINIGANYSQPYFNGNVAELMEKLASGDLRIV